MIKISVNGNGKYVVILKKYPNIGLKKCES